jgi:predicted nuclease of predicted toxin-antitoxin system
MKFLVDSCVSLSVCEMLKQSGYTVEWVPDFFNGDPGDEAIIDKALRDGSVLITGDKDFGEWIFLKGKTQPPLIRLTEMSPNNQVDVVRKIINDYKTCLEKSSLITANVDRIRIREQEK